MSPPPLTRSPARPDSLVCSGATKKRANEDRLEGLAVGRRLTLSRELWSTWMRRRVEGPSAALSRPWASWCPKTFGNRWTPGNRGAIRLAEVSPVDARFASPTASRCLRGTNKTQMFSFDLLFALGVLTVPAERRMERVRVLSRVWLFQFLFLFKFEFSSIFLPQTRIFFFRMYLQCRRKKKCRRLLGRRLQENRPRA